MIKADSRPRSYIVTYILVDALIVIPWALGGFRAPVWVGLVLVGLGIGEVLTIRAVIRGEARRQIAVHCTDEYWLARPPLAPAADLPTSYTVTQRPGWSTFGFSFVLIWMAIGFWLDLFWPGGALDYLGLGISLTLAFIFCLLLFLNRCERIVADEEGLAVRTPYRRQMLRWQEARLFAIHATSLAGNPPTEYELSSAEKIIRLSRDLKSTTPNQPGWLVPEPMDLVLSLISARTGLPLLDLRRPLPHFMLPPSFSPAT